MHQLIPISALCLLTGLGCSDEAETKTKTTDTSSESDTGTDADTDIPSGNTAGVLCDYSQSVFNDDESVNATSTADWSCDETSRFLVANGLPDHAVGTFPNPENPSAMSAQSVDVTFPLAPEIVDEDGDPTQVVAYCINGVKFEVGTAGTCTDEGDCDPTGMGGGQWRMEAVGDNRFDFGDDENHGHVQPTGAYHYHGIPERYVDSLGEGEAMTLVGWAVDGFPIYARYGYTEADNASSAIKVMRGSYVLKTTPEAGRPSVEIYGLGAFTQDWEYSDGSGDLDECNGRLGVTPEFPAGIYHYYLTDSYPFGQRCVKGEAPDAGGPGEGGGPGDEPVDCDEVAPGMPCCGDEVCDGPETADNCPEDCE